MPWPDAPSHSAPACRGPADVVLPAGSSLDPAYVFAVATITNRAHAALGTELLGVFPDGAAVRVRWRPELGDEHGGWGPGVVSELLDHVCSLAALVSLGSLDRFGATMSLRVEHAATRPWGPALVATAQAAAPGHVGGTGDGHGGVLRIEGRVHAVLAPEGSAELVEGGASIEIASGRCTVVCSDATPGDR